MTGQDSNTVGVTWHTTLADLLTLLLVFVITERCNLMPNSSASLNNSDQSAVRASLTHGTDLAPYNPLERLTYLISCEDGAGDKERLKRDLETLQSSREVRRISVLYRAGSLDRCAMSVSQLFDTALRTKVFFGEGAVAGSVAVLIDVRFQHG